MKAITRSMIGLVALLSAGVAGGQCTNTPSPEVGAVNPANGFPGYYVDATGLAMQPCLDVAGCGAALAASLPNPLAPIAFPRNFPQESFYSRASATMILPTGGKAVLEHTVLAAFVGGPVVPGNQFVFSRLRIRLQGLLVFGTYTVTHPYGIDTVTADSLGAVKQDINSGVAGFLGPLAPASRVGPTFLTWDAAPPAAPPRLHR